MGIVEYQMNHRKHLLGKVIHNFPNDIHLVVRDYRLAEALRYLYETLPGKEFKVRKFGKKQSLVSPIEIEDRNDFFQVLENIFKQRLAMY